MVNKNIIYILSIIILITSCVSKKKYKVLEVKYNLSSDSTKMFKKQNKYLDSINTLTVNENSKLDKKIEYLTITIKNMSNSIEIPTVSSIPTIPNPPPTSTDYLEFKTILNSCKTYQQADQILTKAFERNSSKKIYLAFQGEGFAVCTPIDEIDYKGNKIREEITNPETISSYMSYLFSQKHFNDLMFSKTGYYRWIVFIISSDLNNINGNEINPELIKNWVNHSQIKFPFEKLKNPMPQNTTLCALLYEFEQNENLRGKLKLLKFRHITELSKFLIIINLKKIEYDNH